jgi:hypothetical protein
MEYHRFTLPSLLITIVLIGLAGCSGSEGLYPVSGTVKYEDGGVPRGEIADITFQPVEGSTATKGASGKIAPDGTFELTTFKQGDGAFAGEYQVTLMVLESYPRGKTLVAPEFCDFRRTPLKATVGSGGDTDFNFVVKRP